uniref:Uncharacterized protein n=1 Tax=Anguilla anguilla TaxID=7936 RepID=A0A0E9WBN5_ANGAN
MPVFFRIEGRNSSFSASTATPGHRTLEPHRWHSTDLAFSRPQTPAWISRRILHHPK